MHHQCSNLCPGGKGDAPWIRAIKDPAPLSPEEFKTYQRAIHSLNRAGPSRQETQLSNAEQDLQLVLRSERLRVLMQQAERMQYKQARHLYRKRLSYDLTSEEEIQYQMNEQRGIIWGESEPPALITIEDRLRQIEKDADILISNTTKSKRRKAALAEQGAKTTMIRGTIHRMYQAFGKIHCQLMSTFRTSQIASYHRLHLFKMLPEHDSSSVSEFKAELSSQAALEKIVVANALKAMDTEFLNEGPRSRPRCRSIFEIPYLR